MPPVVSYHYYGDLSSRGPDRHYENHMQPNCMMLGEHAELTLDVILKPGNYEVGLSTLRSQYSRRITPAVACCGPRLCMYALCTSSIRMLLALPEHDKF